jgi:4a-hydroxytetrahydrobiopterin dehydratase
VDDDAKPTRQEISDAVDPLGWRLVLGAICAEVSTPSLVDPEGNEACICTWQGRD